MKILGVDMLGDINLGGGLGGIADQVLNAGINSASDFLRGEAESLINKGGDELAHMLGGTWNKEQGWLRKASDRPDPLMVVDWITLPPFGLPMEYVEEMSIPWPKIEMSEGIMRGGTRQYYAQTRDVGTFTATFYEDRLLTVAQWLNAWQSLIVRPAKFAKNGLQGARGIPGISGSNQGYKRNWNVVPQDCKGKALGSILLRGVWPSDVQAWDFGSGKSDRRQVQVTFSVDDIQFVFNQLGNAVSGGADLAQKQGTMGGPPSSTSVMANIGNFLSDPSISGLGNVIDSALGNVNIRF